MASHPDNPQKNNQRHGQDTNRQAQGKQQEQGQRNQPGQQDGENVNTSSDAQLNQGGAGQGQHGLDSASRNQSSQPQRDENTPPRETGGRQSESTS